VLRKARVLAAERDNEPLRHWATHELNGYPDEAALPSYRARRPVPVLGNFAGPFGSRVENMPIPQLSVDERLRDGWLFNFAFTEPVAAYEEALRADQADLKAPWPAEGLVVARPRVLEAMECMTAWRVVPRGLVVGVVEGVRNRLLEFVWSSSGKRPKREMSPPPSCPSPRIGSPRSST
jgi:hypothetical protein